MIRGLCAYFFHLARPRRAGTQAHSSFSLPYHMIAEDLATGRLCRLSVDGIPDSDMLPAYAFHRTTEILGPAGQWMLARLASSFDEPDQPSVAGRTTTNI